MKEGLQREERGQLRCAKLASELPQTHAQSSPPPAKPSSSQLPIAQRRLQPPVVEILTSIVPRTTS